MYFLSFRYKAIVKYKTAFYSFYLPVAAAMYMVSLLTLYFTQRELIVMSHSLYLFPLLGRNQQ